MIRALPLLLLAGQALADEPYCVPASQMRAEMLAEGQQPRGYGWSDEGALIVVWGTDDRALWSITAQSPDGTVCLLAEGSAWEGVTPRESKES